jgi:hypothetical protein
VSTLIVGTVLFGAILARFFAVLVLIPACAVLLASVALQSAYLGHSWVGAVLEIIALITSLEIGYAIALFAPVILEILQTFTRSAGGIPGWQGDASRSRN